MKHKIKEFSESALLQKRKKQKLQRSVDKRNKNKPVVLKKATQTEKKISDLPHREKMALRRDNHSKKPEDTRKDKKIYPFNNPLPKPKTFISQIGINQYKQMIKSLKELKEKQKDEKRRLLKIVNKNDAMNKLGYRGYSKSKASVNYLLNCQKYLIEDQEKEIEKFLKRRVSH